MSIICLFHTLYYTHIYFTYAYFFHSKRQCGKLAKYNVVNS